MKNFIALTSWKQKATDEIVQAHVAFLRELAKKGQARLAGPIVAGKEVDDEAGIFMFKAEDMEAAHTLMATDPFISEGFQAYDLRQVKVATPETNFDFEAE
ncbi:MAG: YciI family protein [Streptococcaceae bacterium]|jgi:uncharacterized protein YciI|nr:YciI family protein [Streptococcaceae bacterium]